MMPTNYSNIQNLILDFGGVIYEISHQKQKDNFAGLGIKNFDELYSQARQSPLFADLERGQITGEDFIGKVGDFIGESFGAEAILRAWNSILVGFPESHVRFLEKLKDQYNLYLLSNTNSIHYEIYIKQFLEAFGYDFNNLFQKVFWSFRIGMRKPDHEIYDFVKSEIGQPAESMLFVDDTHVNITSANKTGIPAIWLEPGKNLEDLFDENLRLKATV